MLIAQQDFNHFWDDFQTSVKAKNKQAVAQHCQFPLAGNVDINNSEEGYNEGEFLSEYDNYFDQKAIHTITSTPLSELDYVDISDREIENLSFRKGYTLMITYHHPEYDLESAVIFTFAYVNETWKLARLDIAG